MEQDNQINALLNLYFQHHKSFYERSSIKTWPNLLKMGVITENEAKNFELNFESDLLNQEVIEIAFSMLAKKLPQDISSAFQYLKEFEKALKSKFKIEDYSSTYSNLFKGIKTYCLTLPKFSS